jgi:hypothetical protein
MARKTISGYTAKTKENLLLDAGAFFKNYNIETDTFDSAVAAGKLIGATRGGGSFVAKATYRVLEVDGIKGDVVGASEIDTWETTLSANVLEVTKENLATALGASVLDDTTNANYHIIKGKNAVEDDDYISNITWVGTLSGNEKPVIIQVYNALSTDGLTINTQNNNEVVLSLNFKGHFDADDLDTPPFAIYYPKAVTQGA